FSLSRSSFDNRTMYFFIDHLLVCTNIAQTISEVNDMPNNIMLTGHYGDGRYADARFEDPMRTGFVDHERRIHFVNLPAQCKISIFTLDGDLVRELDHPGRFSDTDSKLTWNVRSVNNEIVTSGIYLFVVESEWGNQIGKLVIIL
ncbi:MAG: hypothetical protein KKG33_14305, partial [candidate division Zixibacteria bacterium]|nr:hypothetical protein [candidate division Zixibacteria bacterium]